MTTTKPKLVVLNGSLNPPTLGHLTLLKRSMEAVGAARGLFLPASDAYVQRKLAKSGECVLFPAAKRVAMVEAMCEGDASLGISLVDINADDPTTYDSLRQIAAMEPDYELVLAIGADKIKTVPRWRKSRQLLRDFKLVISSRAGVSVSELIAKSDLAAEFGTSVIATFEIDGEVAEVSSSKVRRQFAEGQDYSSLLHPGAAKIVAEFRPEDFKPADTPTWVETVKAAGRLAKANDSAPSLKTCLVGGDFALDIIIEREYPDGFVLGKRNRYTEKELFRRGGKTAGNVSCALAHLGVRPFPIAHFDLTSEGRQITADLERYGADTRFVLNSPKGGTTLVTCTRKRDQKTGEPTISYHATSTVSSYPKHKAPLARDEAPAFLESFGFTPDVFYFDSPAAGWRVIAEGLRARGTLVYYEPESAKALNMDAVAKSDIIKFSGVKITDTSFCDQYSDKLFIRTMASDGLQFKLKGGAWQKVNPVPNDKIVDSEGAGDWTSAQLIASLCKRDLLSVASFTEENIRECLREAVQTASKSLSYLSFKGLIDASRAS